jgi:hypothetical protein
MNDNEKSINLKKDFIEIIESFAPGYEQSFRTVTAVRNEMRTTKLAILSVMTLSWIYVISHIPNFDPIVLACLGIFMSSLFSFWRIFKLEGIVGVWKLRVCEVKTGCPAIPLKWEFHPPR